MAVEQNISLLDIEYVIDNLSRDRCIFNSEADFQFALAWKIKELYPETDIRLEYCPANINASIHIDIIVRCNGWLIPIELKYKTQKTDKIVNGERYLLKSHGAQDIGRYDFLKDVFRIEYLRDNMEEFHSGYAILLTNDPSYLNNPSRESVNHYDFSLSDRSIKSGTLKWGKNTGSGTMKGRTSDIELRGSYDLRWKDYSRIDDLSTGCFKVLIVSVSR